MFPIKFIAACVILNSLVSADPVHYCGTNFRFANTYASSMVLQRAPTRARIWGYGFNVGDTVTVAVSGIGTYESTTFEGAAGLPIWEVEIDPVTAGGSYAITAQSGDCSLTLEDVLFGDVWICSGQSNMQHTLANIDDPQSEIDDVVNYPNVRTFLTQLITADSPQEEVGDASRVWALPTPELMPGYSAVCWLFGKRLYDKYQIPIGLILSSWGGTRIEAWSSPEALDVCFPGGVPPGDGANAASALYNSMIHPFFPMPIYGGIWYQGESNAGDATNYGCAVREMVRDWRARWFAETDTMNPTFPFGQVQLAPNGAGDVDTGFPNLRWYQTSTFGYCPNDDLQGFFMAVAMDLPDYDSPTGAIHPRYKRQVADRLALGAFQVAYADSSSGPYQGPLPTGYSTDGTNVIISHTGFTLEQRGDPSTYFGYEVCCSADSTVFCGGVGTSWTLTDIVSVVDSEVTVTRPCAAGQFVTGVRYSWRVSPCNVLEQCPIYADVTGNNLPAAPFVYNGLIA